MGTMALDGINRNIEIIVPDFAINSYRRAKEWRRFVNYRGM